MVGYLVCCNIACGMLASDIITRYCLIGQPAEMSCVSCVSSVSMPTSIKMIWSCQMVCSKDLLNCAEQREESY